MRIRILPIVTLVIGALMVITMAILVYHVVVPGEARTHASAPVAGEKIWQGGLMTQADGLPLLYKVQDGDCAVYMALYEGKISIATGPGCK